jgi:hypothetical protein
LHEELLGAERARAGSEEGLEDGELLGREVKLATVAGGGAPDRVEVDA